MPVSSDCLDLSIDCEIETSCSTVGGPSNKETVNLSGAVEGMAKNYALNTSLKSGACDCMCVASKVPETGTARVGGGVWWCFVV